VIDDTGARNAIREAASVIAVRSGASGPEVLVLRRSDRARFLPGYVAFPGGATDADDVALAERWFGSPHEAARACAVRELSEEVGLALTGDGLRACGHASFEEVDTAPPRPTQLRRIARWIAPEDVPVRFDAQYFAVPAPVDLDPRPDGAEVADAWWMSPRRLLEDWQAERTKLYWPTYYTVRALADCATVDRLLELRLTTREPDEDELVSLPRSTFWQDG
jgi:8-oxo-dGTP pyrophosphatase MutT (NUDIX family)